MGARMRCDAQRRGCDETLSSEELQRCPTSGESGGATSSAQLWGSQRLGVDEVPTLWPPLGTVGDAETGRGSEASCRSGGK
eukprot:1459070-Rhodomonas_salina.1